jgi:hypothetical protein
MLKQKLYGAFPRLTSLTHKPYDDELNAIRNENLAVQPRGPSISLFNIQPKLFRLTLLPRNSHIDLVKVNQISFFRHKAAQSKSGRGNRPGQRILQAQSTLSIHGAII